MVLVRPKKREVNKYLVLKVDESKSILFACELKTFVVAAEKRGCPSHKS